MSHIPGKVIAGRKGVLGDLPSLKNYLRLSLWLHLGLFVSFCLLTWVQNYLWPSFFPSSKQSQAFVQIDMLALPIETLNKKETVDTSLPVVKTPSLHEQINPVFKQAAPEKKVVEAKGSLSPDADRERKNALKQLALDAKREEALLHLQKQSQKEGRKALLGNQLSQGAAVAGQVGDAKQKYIGLVTEAIRKHFNIYPWQQKKGLTAQVHLELMRSGRVKLKQLVKASADPLFDSAVLLAISAAEPLPLPDDFSVVQQGVDITFVP